MPRASATASAAAPAAAAFSGFRKIALGVCGIRVVRNGFSRRASQTSSMPEILRAFVGVRMWPVQFSCDGIGRRHEENFADLVRAGNHHQRAAWLRDRRQVEEVVLLAERPIHIARIVARLGGIENQDALFADCSIAALRRGVRSATRSRCHDAGGGGAI